MYKKAVFPGKYIQGVGAISELPALIGLLGKQGLIVASPSVSERILPACGIDFLAQGVPVESFRGECCEKELTRLSGVVSQRHVDVLVGMGGGKTIDTAKIVADRAGIPVIVVPTIASTDAPCSGCAVIYSQDGVFEAVCYQKTNPAAVLVDVGIIAAAPTRFLVAGMGDALSTWFEARSCSRTQSANECGGHSLEAGLHIAKLCYETLLAYGVVAKLASERHIVTPALEHVVEANILLSGIGFESAGLAAAHSIHNGLTALAETHSFYHGEKVAFGVLAGLQLADASAQESETVFSFCEDVGLPTTLEDIGLGKASREKLMAAAQNTCAPGQSVHHEAGVITPDRVLDAMLAVDAIGRARKTVGGMTGRERCKRP
ncbi:MAG TPA: glycerol dehydrogenase [Phycisphaerae bacterium]|nr:glycerol dehydrogenase [Phycisphaerae bacterium]HRY70942.1 glycerol dehydrogenase [Phycisphaerae bacterium]HSA29197.1 glycerol dehydrogenase [Phycisphaerae bacterium]